ncbi:hypothetical protein C4D60_Mb11t10110 [Musa balbisiana]|uniref:GRAM domain-containing protein n=1 Tax=Musa balbisiana TaxID=52838 RepID=A0A4S8J321_MUSBA|nr:hypothetical protein C4D60_Mb11t10110 [Musa balbisiana]
MDHGKLGMQPSPPAPPQQAAPGAWVMGTPVAPYAHQAAGWVTVEHIPSPFSTNNNRTGNPYVATSPVPNSSSASGNPYVNVSPVPTKTPKATILTLLGRCGKKLEDTTKKAGGAAGNFWHHLKTSPNVTDAALARLAQGTKVFAEGGNDKVFQQTFGIFPGEQLKKAYACYLSTSAGPVIGILYLSTARIAFCSDNPFCRNISSGQQEWAYYKVVVPLDQLRVVNPSANPRNPSDKYIQIVTVGNHEFWFMGFISYEKALKNLREALLILELSAHT